MPVLRSDAAMPCFSKDISDAGIDPRAPLHIRKQGEIPGQYIEKYSCVLN